MNSNSGGNRSSANESYAANESFTSSGSFGMVHLNLLRQSTADSSKVTDPFSKYEVLEVLGQGSMGSVSKIRILPEAVGGSAFTQNQPKIARGRILFRNFFKKKPKNKSEEVKRPDLSKEHCYALKSIVLDRISEAFLKELRNEIDILRSLDHPNIVKAHEVYECRSQIFLVLELCSGGDLYSQSPYSERRSCRLVAQLLSAIRYMHDRGVIHRDLKFENICFEHDHKDAQLKVIDFGLSKKFLSGRSGMMTERVGTIYTMSPQVIDGLYSSKADLWSIGVIAYMLLSASRPFNARKRRDMVALISSGSYRPMNKKNWLNISDMAKDFVAKLLVVEPEQRLDAAEALQHAWIEKIDSLSNEVNPMELDEDFALSFKHYVNTSKLKKLGLMVIAHRSTRQEVLKLRSIFEKCDTEKNGILSFAEFKAAIEQAGTYTDDDIEEIFESIDVNQNGHIMYTEFLAATLEAHGSIEEDRIAEAFDRLDSDDSGFITRENLEGMLGCDLDNDEFNEIIASVDENGDGKISYAEFLSAFRRQANATMKTVTDATEEPSFLLNEEPSFLLKEEDC